MLDHGSAHALFQRLVAGEPITDGEVDRALAHAAGCPECREQFELGRSAACVEVEEDLPAAALAVRQGRDVADLYAALGAHLEKCERCRIVLAELAREPEDERAASTVRVEPDLLFERALADALMGDADPIVRRRVAERLGILPGLGPRALDALAAAARDDTDQEVRAAALRALDELDDRIAIPERLIRAWAAEPAEAAPFIADVLARLAGERGVTELVGAVGAAGTTVAGSEGISGRVTEEAGELHLHLEGLPPKFEHAKLIVAIPTALFEREGAVEWQGEGPGLVEAGEEVRAGALDVTLGRLLRGDPEARRLFERLYLLDRRKGER